MPFNDPVTGQRTLFMEGHAQYSGQMAQVEIPTTFVKSTNWSSLPKATLLKPFSDVTSPVGFGPLNNASCPGTPTFIYGALVFNGRLILDAACSYAGSQTASHGVRSVNLSTQDFRGWFAFGSAEAPPRALAGPMTVIPPEWQATLGGPALTGQCCISVTGTTSAGPSLTVFNPDDVGVKNPIPGKTVLFYPLAHPACGPEHCEAVQSFQYNLTTVYGGLAFPRGTRSILFVVAHGIGPYCYGSASDCNDPYLTDVKGPHAQPYRYQILAYDVNDIVAVKNGTKQAWEPKPYATFVLDGMPFSTDDRIKGAGYDAESGRLYITQDFGTTPRVEVWQISVPTGSTAAPQAPTNVKIVR